MKFVPYSEKLKDPSLAGRSGIYRILIGTGSYIGSAVLLPKRLRQHLNDLKAGRHVNIHLQRAFNAAGDADFEIVEFVDALTDLIPREQHYIDSTSPRYNIARTAGSQLGFRHSAESRRRISEVQKGKVMSEEVRLRMSAASKGRQLSDEHKANIAASKMGEKNPFYRAGSKHPQFGIPKSKTTRSRISETSRARGSHRGRNNAAARSGVLYDVKTDLNHLFWSLKPLCRKMGIPYKSMHQAAKGERFYMGRYYVSWVQLPEGVARDAE